VSQEIGTVVWINGPVVRARGSRQVSMLEVVEIGDEHLVGEVIGLEGDIVTIQVYEETSGLHPGVPVYGTGLPLSVELGPGLLGGVFDGIQRPLPVLEKRSGSFIERGVKLTPLYRKSLWTFSPQVQAGDHVAGGAILGRVPETGLVEHRDDASALASAPSPSLCCPFGTPDTADYRTAGAGHALPRG
jgi:V/A-type H+-transporting ATPase subunit A